MTEKKPIPVKYFYYGMLACVVFITSVFIYLWQKESKEEKLLQENGIEAEAWVTNLYSRKVSKRATPNYYMEIAFFTDGKPAPNFENEPSKEIPKTSDELIAALAKQTESLHIPLGDYETQIIPLGNYDIYKTYKLNDKIKILFLKENPTVLKIKND